MHALTRAETCNTCFKYVRKTCPILEVAYKQAHEAEQIIKHRGAGTLHEIFKCGCYQRRADTYYTIIKIASDDKTIVTDIYGGVRGYDKQS